MKRQAFTLIELLVVIAILGLLAALILPAAFGAGETADEVKCMNNLTGIGKAIKEWQINVKATGNTFPGGLDWLYNDKRGGSLGVRNDLFLCPFDQDEGSDPLMGRTSTWGTWPAENSPYVNGVSYLYEVSGKKCNFAESDLPMTWAQWKRFQKKRGRVKYGDLKKLHKDRPDTWGSSYPASSMPIVRCFHHQDTAFWDGIKPQDENMDVFNVSWGLNFFKTRPDWEWAVPQP